MNYFIILLSFRSSFRVFHNGNMLLPCFGASSLDHHSFLLDVDMISLSSPFTSLVNRTSLKGRFPVAILRIVGSKNSNQPTFTTPPKALIISVAELLYFQSTFSHPDLTAE